MILTKVVAGSPTAIPASTLILSSVLILQKDCSNYLLPRNVICESFETVDASKLETFDLIYQVHVHYYFQQLKSVISKIRQLLNS